MAARGRWTAGAIAAVAFGVLSVLAGVGLVALYVGGAVIARIGEPDQSLLFWYLPFLMIGVAALVLGTAAFVLGMHLRRRSASEGYRR